MRIGIVGVIGAGWLGGTVGRQWVKAGHEVLFSSRHPERFKTPVRELGSLSSAGTAAEAAAFGPMVLIATPCDVLPAIGRDHGEALHGKIVLDTTNPSPSAPLARDAERDGVGRTLCQAAARHAAGASVQHRGRDRRRGLCRRPRRAAGRAAGWRRPGGPRNGAPTRLRRWM